MTPMASTGEEAAGSMGQRHADLGACRTGRKPLFTYFKQNFAQVTNSADRSDPAKSWS